MINLRPYFALVLMTMSVGSHASPVTWVEILPDNSMLAGHLDGTGVMNEFTGQLSFQKTCFGIPLNLTCDLTFETWFSDSSTTHMDIAFTGFTSTGAGYCNMALLGTSIASVDHNDLPTLSPPPAKQLLDVVDFVLPSFSLGTTCGTCSGSLDGIYTNIDGGSIWLNGVLPSGSGDCRVTGYGTPAANGYMFWH